MPRTIPALAQGEVDKALGSEPVFILEIDWGTGNQYYSEKDFLGIPGKLIDIGNVDAIGEVASISVVISDEDDSIKTILNSYDAHKRPATIYQGFKNVDLDDKIELFRGVVETPVVWDEGQKTVSIDIGSRVEDSELGFSIEESDIEDLNPDIAGVAWPLVFGSVIRSPALKITERTRGRTNSFYNQLTFQTLESFRDSIIAVGSFGKDSVNTSVVTGVATNNSDFLAGARNYNALQDLTQELIDKHPSKAVDINRYRQLYTNAQRSIIALPPYSDTMTFGNPRENLDTTDYDAEVIAVTERLMDVNPGTILIEDSDNLPQGETIDLIINQAKLRGTLSGEQFTVSEVLPTYENIDIENTEDRSDVFTISSYDGETRLKGHYCYINVKREYTLEDEVTEPILVFVYEQVDSLCYYKPVTVDYFVTTTSGTSTTQLLTYRLKCITGKIIKTSPILFYDWKVAVDNFSRSLVTDPETISTYLGGAFTYQSYPHILPQTDQLPSSAWDIGTNDEVYLASDYDDIYVANLIAGSTVKGVYGYRDINGVRKLQQIPSRYYTINQNYVVRGQTVTALIFEVPLSNYDGEDWLEDIFVTQTSTVGPNTADIIKWIVNNYGLDISVNAASFTAVATAIDNYPSHFGIFQRMNVLDAINQIAWQARCATYVKGDTVYIKYLASEGTPVETIAEADIINATLRLEYSSTEELVTKFNGTWRSTYTQETQNKITLRNNIPKYGLIEEDFDFWIYNIRELVIKSATFWLIRYSNTWKTVSFDSFLHKIEAENFDNVTMNLTAGIIADGSIIGEIRESVYNSSNFTLSWNVWLPIKAGKMTKYTFAWPADAAIDEEYPAAEDIYAGGSS